MNPYRDAAALENQRPFPWLRALDATYWMCILGAIPTPVLTASTRSDTASIAGALACTLVLVLASIGNAAWDELHTTDSTPFRPKLRWSAREFLCAAVLFGFGASYLSTTVGMAVFGALYGTALAIFVLLACLASRRLQEKRAEDVDARAQQLVDES